MAIKIDAAARTEFGKGAARRARRDGFIPAVINQGGDTPIHISLPQHATTLALRQANVLLELNVDGKEYLVLPKQIQRHPVKRDVEHVDFIQVKKGEKVVVDVAILLVGEAEKGAIVLHDRNTVSVLADPTAIPTDFELSIDGLEIGAQLFLSDLTLPAGVELQDDPELLVVAVNAPAVAAVAEEAAEAEAEAEAEEA